MVIVIKGVSNGVTMNGDLSGFLDRQASFEVDAAVGQRMDTLKLTLFDPNRTLAIPARAEIIIYDYPAASLPGGWAGFTGTPSPIVDPPASGMGGGPWTPRLFAGYVATADYTVTGPQRQVSIAAQDYTCRLPSTLCNRAYGPDASHVSGWSDAQIVMDIFSHYMPDVDTTNVQTLVASMPTISFPTHTIDQFMARVIKISAAYFRLDYYKRLYYGQLGSHAGPFNIGDVPSSGATPTYAAEDWAYSPDGSNLFNRIWVIGANQTAPANTTVIPVAQVDGVAWVFPLPATITNVDSVTVTVNGADQGVIGWLGADGTLDDQAGFNQNVLIGKSPPVIAFKTPPAAAAVIHVVATYIYPLIQVVSDSAQIAALGGLVFEKPLRDKRILNDAEANAIGNSHLTLESTPIGTGSMKLHNRAAPSGVLLQPGDTITVTHATLFAGLLAGGATSLQAIVNKLTTTLTEDVDQPYQIDVSYSNKPNLTDDNLIDQMVGEQGRINGALEQGSVNDVIQDLAAASDTGQGTDSAATTVWSTPHRLYDSTALWDFFTYA